MKYIHTCARWAAFGVKERSVFIIAAGAQALPDVTDSMRAETEGLKLGIQFMINLSEEGEVSDKVIPLTHA